MTAFNILNRFTGAVQFTAELGAEYDNASESIKLGVAVKMAMKARANLAGADLARADLADANLAGANLARAYLAGAYLARADLGGADLAGADLAGANLADANLAGANLAGAYLARADLARADLGGANLAGADLGGAYLAGAYLARAYLADANDVIGAGFPNGWHAVGWRRDGHLRVIVGCRNFTLAEGRAYWKGKDNRREVLAALDYIEAVARLREWPEAK